MLADPDGYCLPHLARVRVGNIGCVYLSAGLVGGRDAFVIEVDLPAKPDVCRMTFWKAFMKGIMQIELGKSY